MGTRICIQVTCKNYNARGSNFSLITCSMSSDSLKLSVHTDLEGKHTENTDVLLSRVMPTQRWFASCFSFCTW